MRRATTVAGGISPLPSGQPRPAAVTRIASGDTRQKPSAVNNKVMPLLSVVSDETIFLKENSSVFRADATRHFHQQLCQLAGDKHILQAIADTTLELVDTPIQLVKLKPLDFSHREFRTVDQLIAKFKNLGIIEITTHSEN